MGVDLCFGIFFRSCFQHGFGLVLGPSWAPYGGPFGALWVLKLAQVGSKTRFETHFSFKMRFFKSNRKTNTFSTFLTFRGHQKRPKIATRRPQDGLKELLF